jgi:hypothetical protein
MITMVSDEQKYQKIINKIIKKSFPELQKKKVIVEVRELKVGSMWAAKHLKYYKIIIDPIRNNLDGKSYFIGTFAHELVHFKNYSGIFGWGRCFLENLAFQLAKFNKIPMALFERGTDRETVRRGYAKELYKNRSLRWKNSSKEYWDKWSHCYLSPEEIKSYAQKINKW